MRQEIVLERQLRNISEDSAEMLQYVQEIRELNQAYIQSAMQVVSRNMQGDLSRILKDYRKLRKAISGMKRSGRGMLDYECGVFAGAYRVLLEMEGLYLIKEEQRNMKKLLERRHVADILRYLYQNPDAKQISIARGVQVRANHLSEILNSLLDAGYVERYGEHKNTRYCLTKSGRQIYTQKITSWRREDDYVEADYREAWDKEELYERKLDEYKNEKDNLKQEGRYAEWEADFRNHTKAAVY